MDISPIELKSETDFERGFKYKTYIIDVKKKKYNPDHGILR